MAKSRSNRPNREDAGAPEEPRAPAAEDDLPGEPLEKPAAPAAGDPPPDPEPKAPAAGDPPPDPEPKAAPPPKPAKMGARRQSSESGPTKRQPREDRLAELQRLVAEEAAQAGLDVDEFVLRTMASRLGREDLAVDDRSHEPSGKTCALPNHNDGDPRPCVICLHCGRKVRPRELGRPCPAR